MPVRRGGPSTEPLSEDEELQLKTWIDHRTGSPQSYPEREVYLARVAALFFYLGIHPACVAQRVQYSLRADDDWIRWNRTKTYDARRFPMIPELRPWGKEFINGLPERHPLAYNHQIHRVGELVGIRELTPRALRHTRSAVSIERYGFNTAKELMGTTDRILIRYAKRAALKSDLSRLREKGFG